MTNPQATQDHHYVPKFLLRRWADPNGFIEAFRFVRQRNAAIPSKMSARSACQVENLYALQYAPAAERFVFETEFFSKQIDDPAAAALNKVLGGGPLRFSNADKTALARLLLSLPARRSDIIQAARTHFRQGLDEDDDEYSQLRCLEHPTTLSGFADLYFPAALTDRPLQAVIRSIIIAERAHLNKFLAMDWWVRRFDSHELLISDAPLLTKPEHEWANGMNLNNPDLLIALPVGPKTAIFASSSQYARKILRQMPVSKIATLMNYQAIRRCDDRVFSVRNTSLAAFISRGFRERHDVI